MRTRSATKSQERCLTLLARLLHGRKSGWVTRSDPPRLLFPPCRKCGQSTTTYRDNRTPLLDFKCHACGNVFNVFTATAFKGTHRKPAQLVRLVVGVVRNESTSLLARAMGCNRAWLVQVRRRLALQPWVTALRGTGEVARHAAGGVALDDLLNALGIQ